MLSLPAACASLVSPSTGEVRISTRPEGARCDLRDQSDGRQSVITPATVVLNRAATPVTVTCMVPGYRRAVASLTARSDGWEWGNAALVVVSSGVMVLGLAVDETLGAGRAYPDALTVPLERRGDRPPLRLRGRADGTDLSIE